MCRTVYAVISTVICGTQMLVRVIMTFLLMCENVFRMVLQTLYNFISFMLQLISLIPICIVFILSSRLKCFMCGGGGPCPVNRGGTCDCLMSLLAIIILFFIFRATGVLDKLFYSIGYAKAPKEVAKFVPTPGDLTECSRNETETLTTTEEYEFYEYSSKEIPFVCENFTDDDSYEQYGDNLRRANDEEDEKETKADMKTLNNENENAKIMAHTAETEADMKTLITENENAKTMARTAVQYYLL